MRTSRIGPNDGVTLIELMSGITILAILLMVVTPSLKDFHNGIVSKEAIRRFLNTIRYARSQAITQKRLSIIKIKHDGYSFLYKDKGHYLLNERILLPKGISFKGTASLIFHPSGKVKPSTLYLKCMDGNLYKITINSIGHITIE